MRFFLLDCCRYSKTTCEAIRPYRWFLLSLFGDVLHYILAFGKNNTAYTQDSNSSLTSDLFDLIITVINFGLTHDTALLRLFDRSVAGLTDEGEGLSAF